MVWWLPLAALASQELSKGSTRQQQIQGELDATLDQIDKTRVSQAGGQPYAGMVSSLGRRLTDQSIAADDQESNIGTILQAYSGLEDEKKKKGSGPVSAAPATDAPASSAGDLEQLGNFSGDPYLGDIDDFWRRL